MTFEEIKSYLEKKESKQSKVFTLLKDFNWHCRNCEGKQVLSGQYAGGGGIQGLERGTKSRPGLVILSENKNCTTCGSQQMHDKITGEIKQSNAPSGISKKINSKDSHTF